nr:hypothetical protein 5 [Rhodospirillaceae bacterium]
MSRSAKQILLALGATTALSFAFLLTPTSPSLSAGYENINCDSSGVDVKKKLRDAPDGTYFILRGNCDGGPFVITTDVFLETDEGATLSAPESGGNVVWVTSARVHMYGITIDASGANGGLAMSGGEAHLGNVVIENANSVGLESSNSTSLFIHDSVFRNNGWAGLRVHNASGASIRNSNFEDNGVGLVVDRAGAAEIASLGEGTSVFDGNDTAIKVYLNGNVTLSNSLIKNSTRYGIEVQTGGSFSTWGDPTAFENNTGNDVKCDSRGIIVVNTPQLPSGGSTSIDPSCLVYGTIF